MQRRKFLRRQLVLRFVERQMAVDADAAERDIHAAQLVDHLGDVIRVVRVWEDALILRHHQLRADEHRAAADSVVLFDLVYHFQRDFVKHLAGIAQLEQRHLRVFAQLLRGNLIIIHVHHAPP